MTRSNRLNYKDATRAKVTGRFKEMIVVFLLAIAGILVSVTLNAQSLKHRVRKNVNKNECRVLAKKRTGKVRSSRNSFLLFSQNKPATKKPAAYPVSKQLPEANNTQLYIII
jgi:hypothetical protein